MRVLDLMGGGAIKGVADGARAGIGGSEWWWEEVVLVVVVANFGGLCLRVSEIMVCE